MPKISEVKILNMNGSFRFDEISYKKLVQFYQNNKEKYPNIKEETFEDCLNHLYSFGVIGEIQKRKKEKTILSWGYRLDGNEKISFNENTQLVIHAGLKHKFDIQ